MRTPIKTKPDQRSANSAAGQEKDRRANAGLSRIVLVEAAVPLCPVTGKRSDHRQTG